MTGAAHQDVAVRIGDLQSLPGEAGGRLVTVGLGSCVGVAIVDQTDGTAALAHVFLPKQPATGPRDGAGLGTYADVAIPELVRRVQEQSGSRSTRQLVAMMVGGACMFSGRTGADVGDRNVAAVRAALGAFGIAVVAEDVGGSKGRTMRVEPGPGALVTVRVVGGVEREIWTAANSRSAPRLLRAA